MSLSEYVPGTSRIHKVWPGVKLMLLMVVGTTLFIVPRLDLSITALIAILLLYSAATLSITTLWAQLRPAIWIIALLFIVQVSLNDWLSGALVVTRLSALLLLASLVTLTTRSSDMIDALEKGLAWLRFLGINPGKVSLALSLAMRFIPVLASVTAEVREAQRARGLERSIIAIAVPVIVRTLKMADDISAAIEARSYNPGHKKKK
ncbi:energy-coupling factor transporter transmembrane component T family protein [Pectobacterium sp. A5351]|uniref:energy-coupling factor transporter transmembrane component T family protein n=1 Tax=Pectobacterium sp. A5351 TaxID=2914983 RepID=UPI00232D5286|nr:energy-coupling factor transporter transmembrane protein EcfT [Pectobacterium sp. A5351]WCG82661.1 energy-coupling factor transporter transmembrane protein EcfT [Pectobacterium sp. A5351]